MKSAGEAGLTSGTTFAPVPQSAALDELMAGFELLHEARPLPENLPCFSQGWSVRGSLESALPNVGDGRLLAAGERRFTAVRAGDLNPRHHF
jgi:hypothetical protein